MTSALPDLIATRSALREGRLDLTQVYQQSLATARAGACQHVFLQLDEAALSQPDPAALSRPLAGLPVSVKDLFDVRGQVTSAGSTVLSGRPAAQEDAPAVARLRAAGGVVMGRTQMVEFAFSGVGVNPHHGTPAAWDARHGRAPVGPARVPGGSSSGAAVSVATGAAFLGLGSDTGGSIRIPAALNGLVGFKSTARCVPTQGAIPLSFTLDTVGAITRSVRDAVLAHEILSGQAVPALPRALAGSRLLVASNWMLGDLDTDTARAFERSLRQLRDAGATLIERPLQALSGLPDLLSTGGFSPPESYAWHRELLTTHAGRYDPRVAARIERGARMAAHEYIALMQGRQRLIELLQQELDGVDAVISPTTPIAGPALASVAPGAERDAEFFRVNGLLLRNTSAVNTLDGCAISLPCHTPDEPPLGLMAWLGPMQDAALLGLAASLEAALAPGA